MTQSIAEQVATLLNLQNQLAHRYTGQEILDNQDRYVVICDEQQRVLGAVEVKLVQWYQCEVCHLTVDPAARRRRIGSSLLSAVEKKAKALHARIAQCTIRAGNEASENLFLKKHYIKTVAFLNERTGNTVNVYQKTLDLENGAQNGGARSNPETGAE